MISQVRGPVTSIQRAKLVLGFLAMGLGLIAMTLAHAGTSAVSPTMHGNILDDNTVRLTFDDGTSVGSPTPPGPTIPAGTYSIQVFDDSELDNIHLTGPGVDFSTGVVENTSTTWTVTFQSGGSYKFQSDAHPNEVGYFQASGSGSGASGSSSGPTSSGSASGGSAAGSSSSGSSSSSSATSGSTSSSSAASSQLAGTLRGTVNSAGVLRLILNGKTVSTLKSGRYKIMVVDKSPARSFVVRESKHAAVPVSGVSFVGTHSVIVNFTAGHWTFYSSAGAKSTSSFIVVA